MKLTGWHSEDQRPVRKGAYERIPPWGKSFFSYWNGNSFGLGGEDVEVAYMFQREHSVYQNLPWRGVKK